MANNIKCKNMMYEQQLAYLPYKDKDDLYTAIETKVKPSKMAVIAHDKDVDDKGQPATEHIHAMMSFPNARSINNIAKIIGDKPQYIAAWNEKASNGYAYLVHRTENAKTKYQYDPSEVRANFDYKAALDKYMQNIQKAKAKKAKSKNSNIEKYLNEIYNGTLTGKEVEDMITGSEYAKYKKLIEDVDTKRLQRASEEFREKMREENRAIRLYWIYGGTETGKSSLAKELARMENRAYFISGSTRDVFQDYNGEHTIILDELRPNVIPYADLLRITDPYAERVFAPSRYHDKYLSADLIIITTPYSPSEFYNDMSISGRVNKKDDSFWQLKRRITLTLCADQTSFYLAEYDRFMQSYQIDASTKQPNPYSKSARALNGIPSKSPADLYNDLLTSDVLTNGIAINENTEAETDTDTNKESD